MRSTIRNDDCERGSRGQPESTLPSQQRTDNSSQTEEDPETTVSQWNYSSAAAAVLIDRRKRDTQKKVRAKGRETERESERETTLLRESSQRKREQAARDPLSPDLRFPSQQTVLLPAALSLSLTYRDTLPPLTHSLALSLLHPPTEADGGREGGERSG